MDMKLERETPWQDFARAAQTLPGVPALDDAQVGRFSALYDALVAQNKLTNLTRITSLAEFCTRHLLDSLTLCGSLPQAPFTLADVGSGGGFPALPLALLYPDCVITAIEATGKKARAIEAMAQDMALTNLKVIADRAETVGQAPTSREQFDVVTARAVAPLNVLAELCLPLVKPGGVFLAMKTEQAVAQELPAAQKAIEACGGRVESVRDVSTEELPHRQLVVIAKIQATPAAYPRKPGMPEKKPL